MPTYQSYGQRRSGNITAGSVKSAEKRVEIPQPTKNDIIIRQRSIVRHEIIQPSAWWWVGHRRAGRGRTKVGEDPLEMRAISKDLVTGDLHERIVYQKLMDMGFVPNSDFSFQPSIEGGRMELGGMVADFLFPKLMLIIQVQGESHSQYLRMVKDEEQRSMVEAMGYQVIYLDTQLIEDEYRFEDEIRMIFGLTGVFGGGSFSGMIFNDGTQEMSMLMDKIAVQLEDLFMACVDLSSDIGKRWYQ